MLRILTFACFFASAQGALYGLAGPGFKYPGRLTGATVVSLSDTTGAEMASSQEGIFEGYQTSEGSSAVDNTNSIFSFLTSNTTADPTSTYLPLLVASHDVTKPGSVLPVIQLPWEVSRFSGGGGECITAANDGSGDMIVVSGVIKKSQIIARINPKSGSIINTVKMNAQDEHTGAFGAQCAFDVKRGWLWFASCAQDATTGSPCSFTAVDAKDGTVSFEPFRSLLRKQMLHFSYSSLDGGKLVGTSSLSPQGINVAAFEVPLAVLPNRSQQLFWNFSAGIINAGGAPMLNIGTHCEDSDTLFTFLAQNVGSPSMTQYGVVGIDAKTGAIKSPWQELTKNAEAHGFMIPMMLSLECLSGSTTFQV